MKKTILLMMNLFFLISLSMGAKADTRYEIRADGLACPYCAYGVEKTFMQVSGVKNVDVNLKKGLVIVTTKKGVILTNSRLKTLFNDAGFTFRSVKEFTDVNQQRKGS